MATLLTTDENPTRLTFSSKRPGMTQLTVPNERVIDVLQLLQQGNRHFTVEVESEQKRRRGRPRKSKRTTPQSKAPGKGKKA